MTQATRYRYQIYMNDGNGAWRLVSNGRSRDNNPDNLPYIRWMEHDSRVDRDDNAQVLVVDEQGKEHYYSRSGHMETTTS